VEELRVQATIVGYQGEPGSFSEEAVHQLLGAVDSQGYRTFEDLVSAVAANRVDYGLLPCENTIAGPIARAYDVLAANDNVRIVDETTHVIEQCLIGLPGSTVANLERVASHAVAIEQCRRFFKEHPHLNVDVADDTAGSVRAAVERGDPKCAAIGPALAAQRYGAAVLRHGIQDDADNRTRFFLVSARHGPRRALGRLCLALTLPHRTGSLYSALGVFARLGLNLRSLVARPNRRRPFEYVFYVEIDAPATIDADALVNAFDGGARLLGRY
jgi:prephenate dehydratase